MLLYIFDLLSKRQFTTYSRNYVVLRFKLQMQESITVQEIKPCECKKDGRTARQRRLSNRVPLTPFGYGTPSHIILLHSNSYIIKYHIKSSYTLISKPPTERRKQDVYSRIHFEMANE